MSLSLVKKSLQLVESSDFKGLKRNSDAHSSSNIVAAQSRSKRKNCSLNHKNLKTILKVRKQLKEKKNQDKTEQNLEQLKALTKNGTVEENKVVAFFERATKKDLKLKKVEEVQNNSSIFTEEDFAKFEREYDFD